MNLICRLLISLGFLLFIFSPPPVIAQTGSCCATSSDCTSGFTCSADPNGTACNLTGGKPNYCTTITSQNPDFSIPSYNDVTNGNWRLIRGTYRGNATVASVGGVITDALPYFFAIAGFALLIYLIFGAITLLSGYGDPEKNAQGSKIITRALIGYVILFLSFLLLEVIELILGLNIT